MSMYYSITVTLKYRCIVRYLVLNTHPLTIQVIVAHRIVYDINSIILTGLVVNTI